MGYDWEKLAAWTDFAALADIWHPTYAEELPGISSEQMKNLCELESRCAVSSDGTAIAALNALLDDICETIQLKDNEVLVAVESAIRQVTQTGMWADLDELVDAMKKDKRTIRKEAIRAVANPQRLREHLEQEVGFMQAIERAEAALDAQSDADEYPFMSCLPSGWA